MNVSITFAADVLWLSPPLAAPKEAPKTEPDDKNREEKLNTALGRIVELEKIQHNLQEQLEREREAEEAKEAFLSSHKFYVELDLRSPVTLSQVQG